MRKQIEEWEKPLFGGPVVQWTYAVKVTEAYPLISVLYDK